MLEKLAEMVREQVEEVVVGEKPYYSLCYLCELEPANGFFPRCLATEAICNEARKKRDLKLARWAVLLVAKGLEKMPEAKIEDLKERKRIEGMPTAEYMCAMSNLGINFLNLLSEAIISDRKAKEEKGMNIAVDSKVKGRMPECVDMDIVVVDAPNLTSDQISELAQPISPDTATQPSTLKTILQQLILINERLEKWEQTYIAYQEMQRIESRPVYKKKEDTNDAV